MSSVSSGRVLCPQCGVNNFDTQAACWRCGAPLRAAAPVGLRPPAQQQQQRGGDGPSGVVAVAAPTAHSPGSAATADPAIAVWSAWILAFLFPFVAVPVGLVFLMLDERRKVEIGRITLIAGLIFSLLHLIATWAMVYPAFVMVRDLVGGGGRSRISRPADPNQSVPPLQLPGMSQFPGASGPTSVPDVSGQLPTPNFPQP